MVDLADVGRSRAGSDLANFIIGERQRKIDNAQTQERTDAYAAHTNSMADINENRLIKMREQRAQDNKFHSAEAVAALFPIKEIGDYATKLAAGYDYINADGMIKEKHLKEIEKLLRSPMHAGPIAQINVEHTYKKWKDLEKAISDPEHAKKLGINKKEAEEQLPMARMAHDAAVGRWGGYQEQQKAYDERTKAKADLLAKKAALIKAQRGDGNSTKTGKNWVLPNLDIVTSFDGGRTYTDKNGNPQKMPAGAWASSARLSGPDMLTLKSKSEAAEGQPPPAAKTGQTAGESARQGTGPYATLGAAFDAVAGGLGIDKIFGKEGFFKDTQDARQKLRTIKQLGKQALMNSSRGAIWEQKRIDRLFPDPDKIFVNPATEARKLESLRRELLIEKDFNNKAISVSTNPKEINKLRESNIGIDRLMAHIGTGKNSLTDDELMQIYMKE